MRHWSGNGLISIKWNDLSATGYAFTDILVIEKPYDRRGIQILQSGQIFLAAQKITAQRNLAILISRGQKTVVPDTNKPFGRNMHHEPADELFA